MVLAQSKVVGQALTTHGPCFGASWDGAAIKSGHHADLLLISSLIMRALPVLEKSTTRSTVAMAESTLPVGLWRATSSLQMLACCLKMKSPSLAISLCRLVWYLPSQLAVARAQYPLTRLVGIEKLHEVALRDLVHSFKVKLINRLKEELTSVVSKLEHSTSNQTSITFEPGNA